MEITFYQHVTLDITTKDVMSAVNYDGMPHGSGHKKEAPFEKAVIKHAEEDLKRVERLTKIKEQKLQEIQSTSEELKEFIKSKKPKDRAIILLRCINGFSYEAIGEKLNMDRRTVSRRFYKAFGETEKK